MILTFIVVLCNLLIVFKYFMQIHVNMLITSKLNNLISCNVLCAVIYEFEFYVYVNLFYKIFVF